ncbi:hypothetical protein CYMTET_9165 [Cymbomonas tetramitiformis]|uniref:Uncharacterized protein n=1 Tax=Cymbomonas tetramitiformis TaxID=36881 RepID=A0AAE0GSA5_9CHLO|nr:hypothetical protein CYMTET_9165 [Cymbomonas tetramitiformis]
MGLHPDIRTYLQSEHAACITEIWNPPRCPAVCVIDLMWLLFRFRGRTGLELVRFVLRQARDFYYAGGAHIALLTDNPRATPPQKHAEQKRRSAAARKRARDDDGDGDDGAEIEAAMMSLALDDTVAPTDMPRAFADRTFRADLMRYLHRAVADAVIEWFRPPAGHSANEYTLITRFGEHGTTCYTWNGLRDRKWTTTTPTDGSSLARLRANLDDDVHGEADVAALHVVDFASSSTPRREEAFRGARETGVIIRTVDSDSIPILLLHRERAGASSAPLHLWLVAGGSRSSAAVPSNDPEANKLIWANESRRIVDIDALHDSVAAAGFTGTAFCAFCVIMGTDFNRKLICNAAYKTLRPHLVSWLRTVDNREEASEWNAASIRRHCQRLRDMVGKRAALAATAEDFERAAWSLLYWRNPRLAADFASSSSSRTCHEEDKTK